MTGCKDQCLCLDSIPVGTNQFFQPIAVMFEINQFLFKKVLTASFKDQASHGADDGWKFIGADMRVCLVKNILIGTKMHEEVKHPVNVSTFVAAGVKFPVAVSAGAAFPKAIITFRVNNTLFVQYCQVTASGPDLFAPFDDDGLDAQFDQTQCCEQTCRTRAGMP